MKIRKIDRKIIPNKRRVAAYCRVSTGREEQEDSFETQKSYYIKRISENPDWEMAKIYSDKHSATSIRNRPGFLEMLADAENKQLDIILCKSVSRFARNIADFQYYVQRLSTLDCCVIFEKENLRTDDLSASFALSLMGAVAQSESCSISRNVQLSYASRFQRGKYNLGNHRILGYDSVDGTPVPNQDAWIVKEVFCRFIAGESYRRIIAALKEKNARCLRSERGFSVETLRYMLSNETYAGDKCLQKKAPHDYLTKKPDPNRDYHSVYLWNDHEAIIDRETWNKAQEIRNNRRQPQPSPLIAP